MKVAIRSGLGTPVLRVWVLLAAWSAAARAQVIVKVNDGINFRFGAQLQTWAEWIQDPNSEGYSQNLYIRRIRFATLATIGADMTIFYQTDNPNVGNSGVTGAKNFNTGFLTQDAFAEWKLFGDKLMLEGGLFYVPQSRNVLTSTTSPLSLGGGNFVQQQNAVTGSSTGRDWGFGLKGYLLNDHLEYRAGAFSGQRQETSAEEPPLGPAAGSRNSYRVAGRLQYDVFDTEKGYTYVGTNRGARKILAIGGWGDFQGDYKAYGADVAGDFPTVKSDAITFEADYIWYDGGTQFLQIVNGTPVSLLPRQSAFFTHAGYYFDAIKLQPFLRYERLDFHDDTLASREQQRYGGGLNWYIFGQNLKISVAYERIVPKIQPTTALIKDTNHLVVQLQVYYF
jgi:phosphate-selective porin O/P